MYTFSKISKMGKGGQANGFLSPQIANPQVLWLNQQ
jgi:hypothetical protein